MNLDQCLQNFLGPHLISACLIITNAFLEKISLALYIVDLLINLINKYLLNDSCMPAIVLTVLNIMVKKTNRISFLFDNSLWENLYTRQNHGISGAHKKGTKISLRKSEKDSRSGIVQPEI